MSRKKLRGADEYRAAMQQAARTITRRYDRTRFLLLAAVLTSITVGSALTGAPGQPVLTGRLRTSWRIVTFPNGRQGVATNVEYAPAIEDGIGPHGPLTLRSKVGGFHSVKLTMNGLPRLLAAVLRQAKAEVPDD